MGRSKAEILAQLKPAISPEAMAELQKEGYDRWERFEYRPALMTRFRVLHNAISAILCTMRYLIVLKDVQGADGVWASAQDATTCHGCATLNGSTFSPTVELERRLLGAPPLHPGCRCTSLSTL